MIITAYCDVWSLRVATCTVSEGTCVACIWREDRVQPPAAYGIGSPIEQNRKHIAVLKERLPEASGGPSETARLHSQAECEGSVWSRRGRGLAGRGRRLSAMRSMDWHP